MPQDGGGGGRVAEERRHQGEARAEGGWRLPEGGEGSDEAVEREETNPRPGARGGKGLAGIVLWGRVVGEGSSGK